MVSLVWTPPATGMGQGGIQANDSQASGAFATQMAARTTGPSQLGQVTSPRGIAPLVAQATDRSETLHEAKNGLASVITDINLGRRPDLQGQVIELSRLSQKLHRLDDRNVEPEQRETLIPGIDAIVAQTRQTGVDPAAIGDAARRLGETVPEPNWNLSSGTTQTTRPTTSTTGSLAGSGQSGSTTASDTGVGQTTGTSTTQGSTTAGQSGSTTLGTNGTSQTTGSSGSSEASTTLPAEDSTGSAQTSPGSTGGAQATGGTQATGNTQVTSTGRDIYEGVVFTHLGRGAEARFVNEPDALFEFREKQDTLIQRLRDPAIAGLDEETRQEVNALLQDYTAQFRTGEGVTPMSRENIETARQRLQQLDQVFDQAGVPER